MRIRIYDVSQTTGDETERTTCDLSEAFPEPDDYHPVAEALKRNGRTYVGGGAAPLTLIVLSRDTTTCPTCSAAVGAAVPLAECSSLTHVPKADR